MLLQLCLACLALAHRAEQDLVTAQQRLGSVSRLQPHGLVVPIANDMPHQRYLMNITTGTPPHRFALDIDTGSADLWFPAVNSSGCAPSCPPGYSFDPGSSSTIVDLGIVFNATYGLTPDLQIVGEYYNDTVGFGEVEIRDMTGMYRLAIGNVTPIFYHAGYVGLVGLGSRYAEAMFRNPLSGLPSPSPIETYHTLYDQLYLHGYISRRSFSLWLGPQHAAKGELLFGGIDHSKYTGSMLRSTDVILRDGRFEEWAVNLTSIMNSTDGKELLPSAGVSIILDSGAPNIYLPVAVAKAIATQLNATYPQNIPTPYVDCSVRDLWSQTLDFTFATGGDGESGRQGTPRISVPVPELVYPFGDPANIGEVRDADGRALCYLGLLGNPGPIWLLGHTFLRSAYVVFDVDELSVSLAQAVGHEIRRG